MRTTIFAIILFVVSFCFGLFVLPKIFELPNTHVVQITPNDVKEKKLIEWVYNHSTLISQTQCKEIVKEVLKTKHPELMLAIIELESRKFTPGSVSFIKDSPGAIGWCQVRFEIHKEALLKSGIIKEKRDLWDTGPNIRAGAMVFEDALKRSKGNVAEALHRYVGGKDGAYVYRILSTHADICVYLSSS